MRPTNFPTGNMPPKSNLPPQYFDETKKKGEVNELRQLLKNTLSDKDTNKRREVVKKVIAFMTLGIDVSRLFMEMIQASYTNDLIQKKMIYLYLGNYAESNAELAIMAINTYQRDLENNDPKIRGLALRCLFNMKFAGVIDYLPNAIMKGINDLDPYVKKTAIMACIKYFYLKNMNTSDLSNIIDILYSLIRDPNPLVSTNSLMALDEILQEEGGIAINPKMIIYLLNRIKEYDEYGQSIVLELVAKYKPRNESELLDIMNVLDERLKHSSSAIVLGCVKIFLNFTKDNPTIHKQVYERIQSPLITMVTSGEVTGSYELAYIVLSHINFIVSRGGNEFFEKEYKHFYCRTDEPSYIKHIKLEILKWVASEATLGDIMNELGVYVTDIDNETAKASIQALGGIALRIPRMATPIVKQLCNFLNYQQSHIVNETMIVFQDILRKHKDEYKDIIQILESSTEYVTEPEAKCSLIWILGEFGEYIDDAPYIIETLVDGLKESTDSNKVKKILLTSSVRLFLKRPPEMLNTLKKLFNHILANENEGSEDFDLRDRAIFYAKALQYNIDGLKKAIDEKIDMNQMFVEDEEVLKEGATLEFNTLSVIFRKPASKFIKSIAYLNQMKNKEQEELAADQKQAQAQNQINANSGKDPDADYGTGTAEPYDSNLLDLDTPASQGGQGGSTGQLTADDLTPHFEVDPQLFQAKWGEWPESARMTRALQNVEVVTVEKLEEAFQSQNIFCVASGEKDNEMRFYFYGKFARADQLFFVELQINRFNSELNLSVKAESEDLGTPVAKYIEECFTNWQLIA